jgi:hypothetical protein
VMLAGFRILDDRDSPLVLLQTEVCRAGRFVIEQLVNFDIGASASRCFGSKNSWRKGCAIW